MGAQGFLLPLFSGTIGGAQQSPLAGLEGPHGVARNPTQAFCQASAHSPHSAIAPTLWKFLSHYGT